MDEVVVISSAGSPWGPASAFLRRSSRPFPAPPATTTSHKPSVALLGQLKSQLFFPESVFVEASEMLLGDSLTCVWKDR